MTLNQTNYRDNLQNFIEKIKTSIVARIIFHIDKNPTFDKKSIPFDFNYCYSITVITNEESFEIIPSMTEGGFETFWVRPAELSKDTSNCLELNSRVKGVYLYDGYDKYAFKIKIEFESNLIFLYSSDLYNNANGGIDYKINDEMILTFSNENEADKFESIINFT